MRYQRSGKSQRHSVLTAVLTVVILCTTLLSVPTSRMDASSAAGSSDTVRLSKVVVDSGRTLTVNVSAAHGVLPDDAAMSVKTIKRESKEYGITEKKLENYIRHQEKTLDGFLAYRIFFRSDGKDIEPDGNVTITMKWSENISPGGKISGSDRVSVIQLKEKNKSTIKDAKAVELTKNKDQGKGQMQDTDKGKEQKQEQEKKYKKDQNKENQQNQSSRQRENTPAADVRLNQKKELKWAKIKVDVPDVLTFAWIQNSSSGEQAKQEKSSIGKESRLTGAGSSGDRKTARKHQSKENKTAGQKASKSRKEKTEKAQNQNTGELRAETENYDVTVSYGKSTKIPANATFRVQPVSENEDAYKNARAAVLAQKGSGVDMASLGMAALDISIMNGGKEVEPAEPVSVSIRAKHLPSAAETIEIHHITSRAASSLDHVNHLANSAPMRSDMAVPVATGAVVHDGRASAAFQVEGFSIFTITWSKAAGDNTRVANVNIHYVNGAGAELGNPTSMPPSNLYVSGEAELADWAKNAENNGKTRLQGYTYVESHLETHRGTKITKLRAIANTDAATNKTSYYLQYQVAGSSEWTTYKDSVSKQEENNVEVYLVFTKNLAITVHHLDENGDEIADTDTKFREDLTAEAGTTVADWKKDITGYTYDTDSTPKMNSKTGQDVYSIRANQDGRTWLDVEADEGGRNETTQTAVRYYVAMTYTDANGDTQTIQSDPVSIEYYSQLMNGSFEMPLNYELTEAGKNGTAKKNERNQEISNSKDGNQVGDFIGNQT